MKMEKRINGVWVAILAAFPLGILFYFFVLPGIHRAYWSEVSPVGAVGPNDGPAVSVEGDWQPDVLARDHYHTWGNEWVPFNALDIVVSFKGHRLDLGTLSVVDVSAISPSGTSLAFQRIREDRYIEEDRGNIRAICGAWVPKNAIKGDGGYPLGKSVVRESKIAEFTEGVYHVSVRYLWKNVEHSAEIRFRYASKMRFHD
jgi:hypothetical protein